MNRYRILRARVCVCVQDFSCYFECYNSFAVGSAFKRIILLYISIYKMIIWRALKRTLHTASDKTYTIGWLMIKWGGKGDVFWSIRKKQK